MDSTAQPAHLTLLIGGCALTLKDRLISLIEARGDFTFAHGPGPGQGTASFDVIYQAVALRLSMATDLDLAGAKQIFCNLDPQRISTGIAIALGDHVAGGERAPGIIRILLNAARDIGAELGAVAALWRPASVLSGFPYFSGAVSDYLDGGAFPVLAMVNFRAAPGGMIASTGLATLSGQELTIDGHAMDQHDLMRRVVRIAHDIAVNGPFRKFTQLSGIEPGEIITIDPVEPHMLKMNAYPAPDS
jgi:hypothetical protein